MQKLFDKFSAYTTAKWWVKPYDAPMALFFMLDAFSGWYFMLILIQPLCFSAFLYSHCVKSVQIRSYFWSIFSCIRNEYEDRKYEPEITSYLDTFHAVSLRFIKNFFIRGIFRKSVADDFRQLFYYLWSVVWTFLYIYSN